MKKFILMTGLLCSISINAFSSHYPTNLAGNYHCKGTEAEDPNIHYECDVILKKTVNTYSCRTSCNDGTSYIGTGIYDEKKHVFSVVSINPKNAKELAVSMSDVLSENKLTSKWTYLDKTTLGFSTCIKQHDKA